MLRFDVVLMDVHMNDMVIAFYLIFLLFCVTNRQLMLFMPMSNLFISCCDIVGWADCYQGHTGAGKIHFQSQVQHFIILIFHIFIVVFFSIW